MKMGPQSDDPTGFYKFLEIHDDTRHEIWPHSRFEPSKEDERFGLKIDYLPFFWRSEEIERLDFILWVHSDGKKKKKERWH